ncbi:hypothetical protein CONPUDRAFT_85558 [Coniophora puteana RWD-64-598 SS2]|uniref:Uncharacterized protein n=1 Tax=Coniophora puteana (strain RWD-64-598) TaxID=741705 RepID=A0A5M3M7A5_CONPW|nr:uncharacterized protein CONPUDRAFT_85558 [Coniophora puteana RWD-64-598 SS2]EIW74734.1 hypothetical protein CONPUDRAFT_85558 [Coniophora puteana RWD-64-598 SS2]
MNTLSVASHLLLKPLLFVLPFITSLFYPFYLALSLVLDALVVTPYTIATGILTALYPLYVLVGVASIAGLAVGACGRWMAEGLKMAIMSIAPRPWPKPTKVEPKKLQQEAAQKPPPPIYGPRSPAALRKRRRRTAFQEPGTSYQT